jgi:hypothetical protein
MSSVQTEHLALENPPSNFLGILVDFWSRARSATGEIAHHTPHLASTLLYRIGFIVKGAKTYLY